MSRSRAACSTSWECKIVSMRKPPPRIPTATMDPDHIRREMEAVTWYHQIDLGHGIITPGTDETRARLGMLSLPEDLRGRSVLDIGAWDGAFSFEAERLGASRVMAVDSFCWSGEGWGTKAGFECARRLLQSRVEDREVEVMDLSPEPEGGTYDLVLLLGVLYHMKHPLVVLERVASVCANQLILWTQIDLAHLDVPAMAFYPPGRKLHDDPTNWWGPNPSAIAGMLQTVGFSRVENVHTWLKPVDAGRPAARGNAVFHAWR